MCFRFLVYVDFVFSFHRLLRLLSSSNHFQKKFRNCLTTALTHRGIERRVIASSAGKPTENSRTHSLSNLCFNDLLAVTMHTCDSRSLFTDRSPKFELPISVIAGSSSPGR